MTNSGISNRVDYEIQKDRIKNTGKDRPVRDFINEKIDKQKGKNRKKKKRPVKDFFNKYF